MLVFLVGGNVESREGGGFFFGDDRDELWCCELCRRESRCDVGWRDVCDTVEAGSCRFAFFDEWEWPSATPGIGEACV